MPLSLDEALSLALSTSPELAAARLRLAAAQAGVGVAREFPNPEARFERAKETPREAFGVAQLLELPFKRSRRIALARAGEGIREAEVARTVAELRIEVTRAFFSLAAAQRQREVARELRDLGTRARDAAEHRHEVGDVSRLDVLQAALAFAQAQNEAVGADAVLVSARGLLNTLVGRPPEVATSATETLDGASAPDLEGRTSEALAGSTALKVLDRELAEAEARLAVARAERFPDPTVEGTVTHGAEPEFTWGWRAAVAISVPLFTRHQAAVRVEEATVAQLRKENEGLTRRLRGAVFSAATRAGAARDQYLRYRDDVLPKSREVEAMAEDAYREGQTNLQTLLQSLQAARELRLKAMQAAADYQSALADLQEATTVGPAASTK